MPLSPEFFKIIYDDKLFLRIKSDDVNAFDRFALIFSQGCSSDKIEETKAKVKEILPNSNIDYYSNK